jgi:galactitol PTS system EIIA component
MDDSTVRFQVPEELVVVRMPAVTVPEVIERLGNVMVAHGYVRSSFIDAAIYREETSPTGLPTPGLGTAIPHAGVEHTLKPGIAIATLAQPVSFGELGDPESHLDVSIVFMLSVTEPEAQVYLLRSLVSVYRDEAALRRLYTATDPAFIAGEVNAALAQSNP